MTKEAPMQPSYPEENLFSPGPVRRFTGQSLQQIAFPLGGIGAGTVSLGGRGNLTDWEIFSRPGKGKVLPMTFFTLWARPQGQAPIMRILEREPFPPYTGPHGFPWWFMGGMPHFREATFSGEYPLASVALEDADLPVQVTMEAFSPFIPLNDADTSLPVAVLRYRLKNLAPVPMDVTVVGSLLNIIGYDGRGPLADVKWASARQIYAEFKQNLNEIVRQDACVGLRLRSLGTPADDPRFGSLCLATSDPEVTHTARWSRDRLLFERLRRFWLDLAEDGRIEPLEEKPCEDGETDIGSLGSCAHLLPGEERALTFVLTWHFPTRIYDWEGSLPKNLGNYGSKLCNYYATQYDDAWAIAQYALQHLPRLERETRAFHRAFFSSTLPPYVLDAASSQASIIKTNTCLRTEDGVLHAYEGCGLEVGCCPMDCTHVWNYEQAVAHLFPALERSMRRTNFLENTAESGCMSHRTILPLGSSECKWKAATDGQMGSLLKLYREWQLCGDIEFLREMWPAAQRALEYAWQVWDIDRDGVMEGDQQLNTYDCVWHGPNPMTGVLYLGALLAASKMAAALGDDAKAQEYAALFQRGAAKLDRELWDKDYYVQKAPLLNPSQYVDGCLSDQLLGQWFAHVVGLGHLLPREHVQQALASIVRHNFVRLRDAFCAYRIYALGDERGLLNCSYPKTWQPEMPRGLLTEVWTGVEYQVAAHLIYEGMLEEGLALVQAVRERHDGLRRNPWNEFECGDHYARAMASWSLILALSGYRYSAPEQSLSFAPRVQQADFRCFWSTGSGWGDFAQRAAQGRQTEELRVLYGALTLKEFGFTWAAGPLPAQVRSKACIGETAIPAHVHVEGDTLRVRFEQPLQLSVDDILTIETIEEMA